MRRLRGRVDNEIWPFYFEQVSYSLPVANVNFEVAIRKVSLLESCTTDSVLPDSPKNQLRKSLSIPKISQPSSHKSRAHSEPIRPPEPVMRAFLALRTFFMGLKLNMGYSPLLPSMSEGLYHCHQIENIDLSVVHGANP